MPSLLPTMRSSGLILTQLIFLTVIVAENCFSQIFASKLKLFQV